ncbi:MAG: outer membrane beta-barrel protein [Paludibacter sp.]|nr:outer membrane beta-barrel protein [Bacteroidales bacterium]MCM1069603.1 outer membrane beta-barrel protein [Prevotella sp.]MCM1354249.1 outer membrane beta-barrel protein [Bacteroides sp.]MCM1443088.1 outer membrane beta-barrel protein [Muribaculum sp.]MCM1482323.1 outer membrane beta-barrel protein [Paludibacter sp.]
MKYVLIGLLVCCSAVLYAENSLQGRVVGKQHGELLEMATVRLFAYTGTDSTLVQGTLTDGEGDFVMHKLPDGAYKLIISSVGYKEYQQRIILSGRDLNLRTIAIDENVQALGEVQVRGTAAEMVVKGDTLEYNANAYKTAENAIAEDLLKKMPGVDVDTDGNITVNGESITGVRIDGKKFFGNDVQMATKNLPAEMIDKVQIIDEKSDMAKLTGFEDDETERIINFTLKESRKKGVFGNFTGGLGVDIVSDNGQPFGYDDTFLQNDFRYNANVFLNILSGESQTTLVGGANNINEFRSGRGRGPMQGSNSGITWAENLGVNTNIHTQKNLLIGGDVSVNHSSNYTITESERESYANELMFYNYDNKDKRSDTWDTQMRLEFEWQIDSANQIILQPQLAYTHTWSLAKEEYTYLRDLDTVTDGFQNNEGIDQELSASLQLIYSHKFTKPGRTLTLNGNIGIGNTIGTSFNESKNVSYTEQISLINQFVQKRNDTYSYSMKVSYVEPLAHNRHFLETALSFNGNNRTSHKNQYNLDVLTGDYTVFDSLYSNSFIGTFFSETLELNYRYVDSNCDLTVGVKANPSQTISSTLYGNGEWIDLRNNVWNFSPNISFKYKFGKKEFARIMYRGSTRQPSIAQMEPVKDNSNAMNETVGNLSLNPAFQHTLRMMYSKFNQDRLSSITTGLRTTLTKDALVNNSVYDETGKLYQQTVNAKALPYTVGADLMYSTPIVQKRLHLNTRTDISYNKRVAYVLKEQSADDIDIDNLLLGNESKTGNLRLSEDLSLRFTHDIVDIGARGNVTYSRTNNNLNVDNTSNVLNWTVRGDITFHLPYNWSISTDCAYTARYGYQLDDVNEIIWNANIDKTWGNATLSLKVYDMLNQKKNIVQIVGDNYITYAKYNTLPTYFLLSFTYKLNKMGGLKATGRAARMQEMLNGDVPKTDGLHPGMPPMGPPPQF